MRSKSHLRDDQEADRPGGAERLRARKADRSMRARYLAFGIPIAVAVGLVLGWATYVLISRTP